jgi:hypothetical protein
MCNYPQTASAPWSNEAMPCWLQAGNLTQINQPFMNLVLLRLSEPSHINKRCIGTY